MKVSGLAGTDDTLEVRDGDQQRRRRPGRGKRGGHRPRSPRTGASRPTGLAAGTQFRLLFLSSTKRNASSTDIADYNTFIQNLAAAGHTDIRTYSAGFRAVGCTAAVDARDNTKTTYTSTDKGVPIYWLNGAKAADQYEDFYDGSWDDEVNDKNESGTNGPDTSQSNNRPFTGCGHNGTEALDRLHLAAVRRGRWYKGRPAQLLQPPSTAPSAATPSREPPTPAPCTGSRRSSRWPRTPPRPR